VVNRHTSFAALIAHAENAKHGLPTKIGDQKQIM
jgi:hypothetical protein